VVSEIHSNAGSGVRWFVVSEAGIWFPRRKEEEKRGGESKRRRKECIKEEEQRGGAYI
jgi:hypothetical protein